MDALGWLKRLYLILAILGLLQCGGDDGPTAPSRIPTTTPSTPQQPSNYTLTGHLTNAVTEEPVGSARLEIPGVTTTQTGDDGTFEITLESSGEFPLVIDAKGCWRRQTHLLASPADEIQVDIIPDGQGFNLKFFDHVFRDLGRSGTRRWTIEPEFEIWTKAFDCLVIERGFCKEMVATEQDAPGQFIHTAYDVVTTDAGKLTGGVIQGSNIRMVSHPAGTVLGGSDDLLPGWKVTLALVQFPKAGYCSWAWWWYFENGNMYSGHIQIDRRYHKLERGVISHELAHILGYDHPLGGDEVPLWSIMRYDHASEPTRHDLLHGRILYQRPPGSRTPDTDPESYLINAQKALEAPRGRLIQKLVHN